MNIEISEHAWEYLQSIAVPFEDTPMTALDRIVAEHKSLKGGQATSVAPTQVQPTLKTAGPTFSTSNVPVVTFTDVLNAKVGGKPSKQRFWNNVLTDVIDACIESGVSQSDLKSRLFLHFEEGHLEANGYYHSTLANITMKGSSAKRVLRQIMDLSQQFEIAVEIEWRWQQKDQAQMPGQVGKLVLP